jgi:monoamine oxidase
VKIAVVGAGVSGLRTALILERNGVDVTVYDARDRVGGRLETIRLPDGGAYDAGGEWIDADHHRVLALLDEQGVKPEPTTQFPGRVVYQGEETREDQIWPDADRDAETIHEEARKLVRQLAPIPWESINLSLLDAETLGAFLDEHAATPRSRWWAEATYRSDEGDDTDSIGLLGWLVGYRTYLEREGGEMSQYRIPGGAQSICDRMVESLQGSVVLERPLRSIQPHADHVELWFEGEAAFFDRAVLTLPPKALLDVDFGDGISIEKEIAWDVIGSARAIKIALQFETPFWKKEGWKGRLLTDLPCQQCWDGGIGGASILNFYICGDRAEQILERPDPVQSVLNALSEIAPEAKPQFVQGWIHDWINDPWAQGAFASLAPGSVMAAMPHLALPEGLLHFAGEYTSTQIGFIEGALESAERVATEILKL